jgi:hypothetical protein
MPFKNNAETKPILFHEYLSEKINSSPIKQSDIAEELGFEKANVITMFKQGKTRVPLPKVPGFAKILGLDPKAMMKMAMLEYNPELFRAVEQVFGSLVTHNEKVILDEIRRLSNNTDLAITSIAHRQALEEFVSKITGTH